MREQEMMNFNYRWLLDRGDHMDRFDCLFDTVFCLVVFRVWVQKSYSNCMTARPLEFVLQLYMFVTCY